MCHAPFDFPVECSSVKREEPDAKTEFAQISLEGERLRSVTLVVCEVDVGIH
jgi:hypothetical protein